jgi:hypothetical protein
MTCPEGSILNENKMCVMAPILNCPAGYTLVNGMCIPESAGTLPPMPAQQPPPPTTTTAQPPMMPSQQPPSPTPPPPSPTPPPPPMPSQQPPPPTPPPPPTTTTAQCPSGYEYRDSMCYPLRN